MDKALDANLMGIFQGLFGGLLPIFTVTQAASHGNIAVHQRLCPELKFSL